VARTARARLDPDGSAEAVVAAVVGASEALGPPTGARWAVAVPGPFDYAEGVGRFEHVGKFEALNGYPLRQALVRRMPSRPSALRFLNDAQAYGLGEWDAAGRPDRLICITLGTGVGSAFVAHGRPVTGGPDVPPLGEVHRLTWAGRDLEDHVSRRAIRRAFLDVTGLDRDVDAIARLARSGDAAATEVLDGAMTVLGGALGGWVARFRPDVLVVGGSMSRSWDLLAPPLGAALRAAGVGVEARASTLLEDAALLGAARWLDTAA
jgi:glucokinase